MRNLPANTHEIFPDALPIPQGQALPYIHVEAYTSLGHTVRSECADLPTLLAGSPLAWFVRAVPQNSS